MSASITITLPKTLTAGLAKRISRRLARSINRTLEEGQERGRQLLHQRLTVRTASSAKYLEGLVRFERSDRATDASLAGRMGLQSTGSGNKLKSAGILISLATGVTKTRPSDSPFWIPTTGPGNLRPSRLASIPQSLRPKMLRLVTSTYTIPDPTKQAHQGKHGVVVMGKRRTFAVDPEFHHNIKRPDTYGIYQRRGTGKESQTFLLWSYRATIRIPKRYPFTEEVMRTLRERAAINFDGFFSKAVREP